MEPKPADGQRLRCPHCSRILKIPAGLGGSVRRCPHCDRKVRIPDDSSVAVDFGLWEQETQVPEWVPVVCDVCSTRMHATRDQIGSQVKCPDCGRANLVRQPVKPAPKWQPNTDGEDYGVALAPSEFDDEIRVAHARELLAAAQEEMLSDAEIEPDVPQGPARKRAELPSVHRSLLQFLFNLNVWPQWLGIVIGCLAISVPIEFIITAEGKLQVLAVLMCVVVAIFGTLFLSFFATRLLDVLEMTANDAERELIEWPEHDMASRFVYLLYFFNAACFSALPGGVLGGSMGPGIFRGIAAAVSMYLLFPIVLLSMVDHGSCMIPYSMRIWRSVERIAPRWIGFYLRSGMLVLVVPSLLSLPGKIVIQWPQRILVVIYCVLAAWVYVRWLGQLGASCLEFEAEPVKAESATQEPELPT